MTHPLSRSSKPAIPVLLPSESVTLARQLAQQHPETKQAQLLYCNLLAVLAVRHYLTLLGLATDLNSCDCWHPFLRLTTRAADLDVVGHGRIECCPASPDQLTQPAATVPIPADDHDDRIGYVVVQVEDDLEYPSDPDGLTVMLVGFIPQANGNEIVVEQLRSLFDLPHYLHQQAQPSPLTHLTNWLKQAVETDWTPVGQLLGHTPVPNYAVRNAVRSAEGITLTHPESPRCIYGKTLQIKTSKGTEAIALLTEVISTPDEPLAIELRICPLSSEETLDASQPAPPAYLPPGLEMVIVDELGDGVMQAQARQGNRMMELGFHAQPGDRFQLHIQLDDTVVTESFLV